MNYWIDATDRLARVDEAWREFAIANGASELASERVLGRPISSFCTDATTNEIWTMLLARARLGTLADLEIHCDSPDCRRLFRVTLTNDSTSLVRVAAALVFEERRARVELLEVRRPHSADLLVCCSWCKKWKAPSGLWVEVEEIVSSLPMGETNLPQTSHGICEACRNKFAHR
jgi:hypothetical protein